MKNRIMSKSLTTIESHVSDIVESRQKTKDARFKPLPFDVEHVDEVLHHAVYYLAEQLATKGFTPAVSRLSLSRKHGPITQTVSLDRVGSNLSGVSVAVGAHVSVSSASYGRWCTNEGTGNHSKYLWTRQLGYLSGQRNYLRWQLVDSHNRQAELENLLGNISTLALPAFSAWETKQLIGQAVFRFTELDRIDWLMSAALWAGDVHAAARLISEHLEAHPKHVPEYKSDVLRFRASLTSMPATPISGAAFLVVRHGINVAMS
jgi:hypothetical protein